VLPGEVASEQSLKLDDRFHVLFQVIHVETAFRCVSVADLLVELASSLSLDHDQTFN
jgi:hypothetical protein